MAAVRQRLHHGTACGMSNYAIVAELMLFSPASSSKDHRLSICTSRRYTLAAR
ncbi:hypothetical protein BAUCODRAFT_35225 [Baudoinia panamericana UAMH 10762]|uniref:Uncharacterized protein n=1 Tax=Baudoinia panamericana (strain UAMH 10762) TaxID=717646 RepID=M2N8R7_BAUPA|nr:uncharacterized protein BAUCODRAFT_35225 [Baudoinia panamericana UAMH 10762]EMC95230.1 hypothetical protein BAUCODRAFT_35225 [Baudoinia panamericana UAMH 10762]